MIKLEKQYTYDEMMALIFELECRYEQFLTLHIVGMSHDERRIPMIKLGTGTKCLICSGGIHGRESSNPVVLLKMLEAYCEALISPECSEKKVQVSQLLEHYSICLLPLLNPDGYEVALFGFSSLRDPRLRQSARMLGIDSKEWKYNGRGVDINRNFPCRSFLPSHYMKKAASENETKVLLDVFDMFPESVGYLDFHSRGKLIYYYRSAMPEAYNAKSKQLAKELKSASGYRLGDMEEEFETAYSGGNSVNYYSEQAKMPALTIETVEDESAFPLKVRCQEITYDEVHNMPLVFLENL